MISVPRREKPRATRPLLATAILLWLFLGSVPEGQVATAVEPSGTDLWRWAIERGGLTLVILVLGWSYRKDMTRWAEERVSLEKQLAEAKAGALDDKIGFQQARVDEAIRYHRHLEQIVERTNETLKATADALAGHTTALALHTRSNEHLAHAVDRLGDHQK